MQNTSNGNRDSEHDTTSSRQRTRHACEPCKLRKRRCDGAAPCGPCQRYRYGCHYSSQWKRRSKKIQGTEVATPIGVIEPIRSTESRRSSPRATVPNDDNTLSPEVNSGTLFPQLVGTSLGSGDAPKLQGLGWNLGHHYVPLPSDRSITSIISKDEWLSLFAIYIQKIHSVYNFLDLAVVRSKSIERWDKTLATNSYDHVLCGIAALACLFTPGPIDQREQLFVDCARDLLQSTSDDRCPGPHEAQASILRLLYVRINCPPHAAWMISGATMQVVEASGLHKEDTSTSSTDINGIRDSIDTECRRKTYWLAKLFNTWISNEHGRTQFGIIGATCLLPTASSGDPIAEFMTMLQASAVLEPEKRPSVSELELTIRKVEQYTFQADCLILSKANLCFTLYRRLRLVTGSIKHDILDTIINIGVEGLQASSRATQAWTPWWHVSNIPFQFTCILLAMDTPEALSHVAEAVTVLRRAVDTFQSRVAQTALTTIEQLVALSHKRKQQGVVSLASVLPGQDVNSIHNPFDSQTVGTSSDFPADAWLSDLLWSCYEVRFLQPGPTNQVPR